MRILLITAFLGWFQVGLGQKVVDVTNGDVRLGQNAFSLVNGTPFVNTKYVSLVDGTPYFKDDWMKGILVSETGQEYKDLMIKLDLVDNKIHYKDEKNVEMLTISPIKQVIFTDAEGNNYKFVHSSILPKTTAPTKEGWYLWLGSGTASLYKYFQKKSYEERPYNSATTEQHIKTMDQYLVLYNNAYIEIKKIKEAPDVLANKKAEITEFLKTKDNPKESMDDRMTALMVYYNSLFKETAK